MSTQEEIASVERDVKQSKKIKDLGSAYERLCKNRDFLAVIKESYFKDEAVRLVHLRGDPAFQTPERQANILRQMDAISFLHGFFITIQAQARMADKAITEGEAFLEDAAVGEDN